MPMQVRFLNTQRLQVRVVALPGNVLSVFGRQGAVVATNGDYTASQVTNVPSGLITAINVQDALNQLGSGTFISGAALTKTDDTNVTATLGGTPTTALLRATSITIGWTGTLAAARLNSNVVQAVTNDTNVTGSISTQTITLGWTSTLAVSRGGTGTGTWATNTIIIGGTTGTGTFQQVASGGAATVLTSNGPGVLPSWQVPPSANTSLNGQCRLTKSSTNLLLSPFNGNQLIINSVANSIPDAGVTLAAPSQTVTMTIASPCVVSWTAHGLAAGSAVSFATSGALPTGLTAGVTYYVIAAGLAADTFEISTTIGGAAINTSGTQSGTHKIGTPRYIYAFMSGATMTLEHSTMAYTTQATTNVRVKSGDVTRTLIGFAYDFPSGSATVWTDSAAQRFVRSWFNRGALDLAGATLSAVTTTSTTYVELSTSKRVEWVQWATDVAAVTLSGVASNDTLGSYAACCIGIDGTSPSSPEVGAQGGGGGFRASVSSTYVATLADGYHFAVPLGAVSANTGKYGDNIIAGSVGMRLVGAVG